MKMFMFIFVFILFCLCVPAFATFEAGQKAFIHGNYDKAFLQWRQAAEEGDLTAQRNIAHLYRWGKGVPQDLTQAAFWYYMAARGGLDTAQYNLGVMYLRGEGVPRILRIFRGQDFASTGKLFIFAGNEGIRI